MAASAQDIVPGHVLIALNPGFETPDFLIRRFELDAGDQGWTRSTKVSEMLQIWLFTNEEASAEDAAFLVQWMRRQPEVLMAQTDHLLTDRMANDSVVLPNDPLFNQQWQYQNTGQNGGTPGADLSAIEAWNISTGGLSPADDTVVVAVIDGGLAAWHPDLQGGSIWRNHLEIPNDGLDNDNNGYIDDYRGWNVYHQDDDLTGIATYHGTPIAGIIGARGNNNIGVCGVNWAVQTMFVAGKGNESVVLAAFDYVWKARKRYNETNGTAGAFVVALNCSWGIDYGQASEAPLWCAAFDSLGAVGILTVAATANNPVDVDVVGDIPTTCPSAYLVTVTSLDRNNHKAPDAAWGASSIDLGAYGADVFTINNENGYGTVYGTSFAAPHVAGGIGLLYAAPCPNLVAIAKMNPAAGALFAKSLLLQSTVPTAAMEGVSQTGGRLDLFHLLNAYQNQCSTCPPPFGLSTTAQSNSAQLFWYAIATTQSVNLRWRKLAAPSWNLLTQVNTPLPLSGLEACTQYEFSVRAQCGALGGSTWTEPFVFSTTDCCAPPTNIQLTSISSTSAQISWPASGASLAYQLRYRAQGELEWHSELGANPFFALSGLNPCTDYAVVVRIQCDTGWSTLSVPMFFQTTGCGACLDATYCTGKSNFGFEEWIANVQLGTWQHSSQGSPGYQDFTGASDDVPVFYPSVPASVSISPGFSGLSYNEHFRLFIDFNQDGDFEDTGELAFAPGFPTDETVFGTITPPAFVQSGLTRMRVMMKYKNPFNLPPAACETFDYGEVEDYCVRLLTSPLATEAENNGRKGFLLAPNPAQSSFCIQLQAAAKGNVHISIADMQGRVLHTSAIEAANNLVITIDANDWPAGAYMVQVADANSVFSKVLILGN